MRACARPAAPSWSKAQTTCCYATSEKSWIEDPSGISWETFFTTGESTDYGVGIEKDARVAHAKACCAPESAPAVSRHRPVAP